MVLLADVLVVIHFFIAAFITSGFVLIPLGAWRKWQFVRRRWLRLLHLVGILFVAGETLVGMACPLTLWENALRHGHVDDGGFIAAWARWVLYYDVPLWIFGLLYVAAALLAIFLWLWIPPDRDGKFPKRSARSR